MLQNGEELRTRLIESLSRLGQRLAWKGLPPALVAAAVKDNPWFTPYYIHRSLANILPWFAAENLLAFLAAYPLRTASPKRVGIIAAGNLPWVAWHDVMVAVLSGHEVWVKPSHRDRVLMQWLISQWISLLPGLTQRLQLTAQLDSPDFVVATGSNNTARYLNYHYQAVPKVIRKNRYSVALLRKNIPESKLDGLCEDVLLFNGLGCRNVSNLFCLPGADWQYWWEKVNQYAAISLNPLYLERVLCQKVQREMLEEDLLKGPQLLAQRSSAPAFSSMGVIQLIDVKDESTVHSLLKRHREEIQCVVGMDTDYGKTQSPGLKDFADNLDTMALLVSI